MMLPLVRDLAADPDLKIPVAVTCRVLGFSKQAYYAWRAGPISQRDRDDAHLINAAVDIHHDDPEFGYRFITDELAQAGITAGRNRVNRLCSQQRLWSAHARKRGQSRRPGPPVHDDLVRREFTAAAPNVLWLTDITEHPTAWIPAVVATPSEGGGTVRAAAGAVGVGEASAYSWLRRAGLTVRRAAPRIYTEVEKAEFFRRLAESGNVSAVARELGFTRVTCYKWANQAGIFTSEARRVNPRHEEFLRLRAEGMTRAQAAQRVHADKRSAADWDKGITIIHRGRVYPDGRVVRYPDPTLSGMNTVRTAQAIGGTVDLDRVEKVIHPRYLSLLEREQLRDLRRHGLSIRAIAAELNRSPSTISRELRRNTVIARGYLPHTAHRTSVARRRRPRPPKLLSNAALSAYVQAKLNKKWSPQQISHRLVKDFPDTPEMRVSTETIYQAIYVHTRGELKRELGRQLRRGRTARKPRRDANTRRPRFIDPMTPIAMRPAEADARAVPGHWEGDLIIGATGRSAIATLVERSSRFVMLGHLGNDRNADVVRDSLIRTVAHLPAALRGSLTWDQGAEMAEHRAFSIATDIAVYFCDPGSPWQRGSNENTNGLLRQYFPRNTDLKTHDQQALRVVADELNGRPRKSLGWDTPTERLTALLNAR